MHANFLVLVQRDMIIFIDPDIAGDLRLVRYLKTVCVGNFVSSFDKNVRRDRFLNASYDTRKSV